MIWLLIIPFLPYLIIFFKVYRKLLQINQFIAEGNCTVTVSVIVACRNEEKNLPLLLNDLSLQDYDPGLFEIIIVDDNSTDNTFKVASAFNQIKNYKVVRNLSGGKKSAIKTGVDSSAGRLVITTDADCRMNSRWISALASFYNTTKPEMIIAPVQLEDKPGFFSRFRELEFFSLQGVTAGTAEWGNPIMCNGANLAFTREAYKRHSEKLHYEIQSGDDIFFLHSLKKESGSKITWISSPDAVVTTRQTETINSFIKQRSRWLAKAKAYDDRFTLLISIIIFLVVLLSISFLVCSLHDLKFLVLFLTGFIIKVVPDYLILTETTSRYNKRSLMKWFIPSQFMYPFYVVTVVLYSLIFKTSWK